MEEQERIYHHAREGGKLVHSGCEVLPNMKPINATITHIEFKYNEQVGGVAQDGFVAYFKELKLPIFLNATNKNRLIRYNQNHGVPIEECDLLEKHIKNLLVTLQAEECRDPKEKGGKTMGIRISKIFPKPDGIVITKQKLDVTDGNFAAIKSWLAGEGNTLAGVISKYELSEAALAELKGVKVV